MPALRGKLRNMRNTFLYWCKKRLALCCTLLALIPSPASAQSPLSETAQKLARVSVFAMGYVGFVAHISDEEKLFSLLMQAPDAVQTLNDIMYSLTATPEAKLYALCGLRQRSMPHYIAALGGTYDAALEVSVLQVDILKKVKFQEFLAGRMIPGCTEKFIHRQ